MLNSYFYFFYEFMPTVRIKNSNENTIHFLTITVIEWIDVFTKPEYFKVIIESLKYCVLNKGLLLYEYVIMTNHIHLICQAKEGSILFQIISDFKKHTTRNVIKLIKNDNRRYIQNLIRNSFSKKKNYTSQIWQRENYPEVIVSEKFLNSKIAYIHNNPVKKEYVKNKEDWLYSSARNRLLDDHEVIEVDDYRGGTLAPQP